MFVRFVVHAKDKDSGRRRGVFHAAGDLRKSPHLSQAPCEQLDQIRAWFNENLERPERLSLSAKPNKKAQAISWFKESALEHITQIRAMVLILESHGVAVERIRTRRPGYIVYEDDHQVAAYPFADTPT